MIAITILSMKWLILSTAFVAFSAQAEKICTYETGYAQGASATPYDNSCSAETEEVFLAGFGIGRKAKWLDSEVKAKRHKLSCLEEEKNLALGGTLSPIAIGWGEAGNKQRKKLADRGCPGDIVRTEWGMAKEIKEAEQEITAVEKKQIRLRTLHSQILAHPEKAQASIKNYESGGADEMDVSFRWKSYIEKKGGIEQLSMSEKTLLYDDINKNKLPPSSVGWGSLIGFGLGHARQGRFSNAGWAYAIFDSLALGAVAYGFRTHQNGISLPVLVFAIPLSRAAQYVGVYRYNLDHSEEMQQLRTERKAEFILPLAMWEW